MPVNNEDPYSSGLLNYDPAEFINSFKSPIVNLLTQANNAIVAPSVMGQYNILDFNVTWDRDDDLDLSVWEPDGNSVSTVRNQGYGKYYVDSA
jgi:hypothetical protein